MLDKRLHWVGAGVQPYRFSRTVVSTFPVRLPACVDSLAGRRVQPVEDRGLGVAAGPRGRGPRGIQSPIAHIKYKALAELTLLKRRVFR